MIYTYLCFYKGEGNASILFIKVYLHNTIRTYLHLGVYYICSEKIYGKVVGTVLFVLGIAMYVYFAGGALDHR